MNNLAIRPSSEWRCSIAEEARLVAEGVLEDEFAVTAGLFPPALLQCFDEVFDAFERDVSELEPSSDIEVTAAIRRVVLELNSLNEKHDHDAIATAERALLCGYIDQTMTEAGVDLDALAARRGVSREDITDEWRTW
ncbi:hypothetical protein ACIBSW_39650 [Actinoplanes sp. NPDC049668]|uniref:hypothetical protein n=1 Tax=unclassified Actinoplanes TaxID=2626549 RepID=UPI0033ADCC86